MPITTSNAREEYERMVERIRQQRTFAPYGAPSPFVIFNRDTDTISIGESQSTPIPIETPVKKTRKPRAKKDTYQYSADDYIKRMLEFGIDKFMERDSFRAKYLAWRKNKINYDYKIGKDEARVFLRDYYLGTRLGEKRYYPESYCIQDVFGKWILKIDAIKSIEGDILHLWNTENYIQCSDTGYKFTRDYKYIYFDNGGKYIHRYDKIKTVYFDGITYEKKYARTKGIVVCKDCGRAKLYNNRCICDTTEIDRYHSTRDSLFAKGFEDAKMRVGLEIEKIQCHENDSLNKLMKKSGWRCEYDSSAGYEFITPVLSLDDIEKTIEYVKETGHGILEKGISSRCGGHIHVSVEKEKPGETYDRIKGWRPLLWALYPDRVANQYCNRREHYSRKYVDVGIRDYTVEVRIFPGLDSERKLRFRLSLLRYFLDNPKKSPQDALENIYNDEKLHDILRIAYGENTVRLGKFFNRLERFYSELGESGEITENIIGVAKKIIGDKEQGKTDEELRAIESIETGE